MNNESKLKLCEAMKNDLCQMAMELGEQLKKPPFPLEVEEVQNKLKQCKIQNEEVRMVNAKVLEELEAENKTRELEIEKAEETLKKRQATIASNSKQKRSVVLKEKLENVQKPTAAMVSEKAKLQLYKSFTNIETHYGGTQPMGYIRKEPLIESVPFVFDPETKAEEVQKIVWSMLEKSME